MHVQGGEGCSDLEGKKKKRHRGTELRESCDAFRHGDDEAFPGRVPIARGEEAVLVLSAPPHDEFIHLRPKGIRHCRQTSAVQCSSASQGPQKRLLRFAALRRICGRPGPRCYAVLRGATRCYAPFKQLVMASQSAFHKWAVPNLIRFGKGEVDLHPTHF